MRVGEASTNEIAPTLVFVKKKAPPELTFNERVASLRKERGLTQQGLAELVGMHISQIRRYEAGHSQLQFKGVSRLDPEEKKVIRSVIESIILRNTMKETERRFSLADLAGDSGGSTR
jgi:ribosome-binding protein aMBF1 (putative translation factor)